jgi:hypothetical protein
MTLRAKIAELTAPMRAVAEGRFVRRQRYRAVFSGPDGKWVLRDIVRRGFAGLSLTDQETALGLAFRAGQHRLVVGICKEVNMSDEDIVALSQEPQHE